MTAAEHADVIVIGGGSTGTSTAWQLVTRGAGRVVLIERGGIASGATGRSSAIIRQHYTHEALTKMALYSLGVFQRFEEIVGGHADFRESGFMVLVGPTDVDALRANVAMHRRVGVDAHALTPADVLKIEPRLDRSDVGAAAWEPQSGYADPVGTTAAYAAAARASGVSVRLGIAATHILSVAGRVAGLETTGGRITAGSVIVAAGYRSTELLLPLGIDLQLTPVRHAIAIVERSAGFGRAHPIIGDRIHGSYYRPEGTGLTLIGTIGAMDGRVDPDVDVDRALGFSEAGKLAERFLRRFPVEEQARLRTGYTGVYDCSADLHPIIGALPTLEGLYVAAGLSGHGFKLSPAIGLVMADLATSGRTSLVDAATFSPLRFAEGRPIHVDHPYSVLTPE